MIPDDINPEQPMRGAVNKTSETTVTRDDAIAFLEVACRNWSKVPKLSEEDIGDVAMALLQFYTRRAPEPQPEVTAEPVGLQWNNGEPPKPWRDEWFIAETFFGDRVVLISLPEEWTYDYKTADETYIKADRIKRWMQFPDSQFKPTPPVVEEAVKAERCDGQLCYYHGCQALPGCAQADARSATP